MILGALLFLSFFAPSWTANTQCLESFSRHLGFSSVKGEAANDVERRSVTWRHNRMKAPCNCHVDNTIWNPRQYTPARFFSVLARQKKCWCQSHDDDWCTVAAMAVINTWTLYVQHFTTFFFFPLLFDRWASKDVTICCIFQWYKTGTIIEWLDHDKSSKSSISKTSHV